MLTSNIKQVSPEMVLDDVQFFLQQIDPILGTLNFVKTTRKLISSLAFIDGRSNLSIDGIIYSTNINAALSYFTHKADKNYSSRFIHHMSFCGSTLLARSCDIINKVISYKEPQALIDLAKLKVEQHMYYDNQDIWQPLVKLVIQQVQKSWSVNEVSLIKPSNWVNSILPDLHEANKHSKAIFMTICPNRFLIAVLRGGKDRITYIYNLLFHLKRQYPEFTDLINSVESAKLDIIDKVARMTLITHYIQSELFARAKSNKINHDYFELSYDNLLTNPSESLLKVSQVLKLNINQRSIADNISRTFNQHAKHDNYQFNKAKGLEIDSKVEHEYKECIFSALNWYEQKISPNYPLAKRA